MLGTLYIISHLTLVLMVSNTPWMPLLTPQPVSEKSRHTKDRHTQTVCKS